MISVSEMKEIERKAVESGIDEILLMENAGANAARIADQEFGLNGKKVLIFCGSGNNAGDGLVFARHALIYGASVMIFMINGTESLHPLPKKHYQALKTLSIKEVSEPEDADMVIDAMLGTGIRGEIKEPYVSAIEKFNSMKCFKISLDCPSGIDCDTGDNYGALIRPDITITFHDKKIGLNKSNSGRIIITHIGIPKN